MGLETSPQTLPGNFKSCPLCNTAWTDRSAFLADGKLRLMGYQANPEEPANGILLFQHLTASCGTSLAVRVLAFADLYKGPKHATLARGTAVCEHHCENVEDLSACKAPCSAAFVRSLIQIILALQKAAS